MTHEELCERARRWLSGSRRCDPVFSNVASCSEIPDAIGWASSYQWRGSTVIECKTSISDFHADKKKRLGWKDPDWSFVYDYDRIARKVADEVRYKLVELPMMGDYRFYFCESGVISSELVTKHAPDHGLLYVQGRRVEQILPAPKRENVNKDAEIRFLRFAIINGKEPHRECVTGTAGLFPSDALPSGKRDPAQSIGEDVQSS